MTINNLSLIFMEKVSQQLLVVQTNDNKQYREKAFQLYLNNQVVFTNGLVPKHALIDKEVLMYEPSIGCFFLAYIYYIAHVGKSNQMSKIIIIVSKK